MPTRPLQRPPNPEGNFERQSQCLVGHPSAMHDRHNYKAESERIDGTKMIIERAKERVSKGREVYAKAHQKLQDGERRLAALLQEADSTADSLTSGPPPTVPADFAAKLAQFSRNSGRRVKFARVKPIQPVGVKTNSRIPRDHRTNILSIDVLAQTTTNSGARC